MKERVKLGVIGLGNRGHDMLKSVILPMQEQGVDIAAVCDLLNDRTARAVKLITDSGAPEPFATADYKELLTLDGLDTVYIATPWESHISIAIDAMKAGVYAGMEVGCTYSLEECYRLIDTYEQTGTECMLMENCCYGKRELMILNMVRKGVLGDIVHCNGAYSHDLRKEITEGKETRHYRLRNYIKRNCENYPTHEIGPIAKILDINNGNRFVTLSSFASASKGLKAYAEKTKGKDHPLANTDYNQGDVITTVITCANGQTVSITLNTTLPHAYSRRFEVHGTSGMYMEDNDSVYLDNDKNHINHEFDWKEMWGNANRYEEEYIHPLCKNMRKDGHGGMDHIVMGAFIEAVKNGSHPPIDVYDTATYLCISVLSEESIAKGGAPVVFPDFTNGKWTMRDDITENAYTLDKINNGEELYHTDRIIK